MTQLQVLICTFGPDGIRRVAECRHPQVDGVEYIVSWQLPEGEPEIPPCLDRSDFRIFPSKTRGLSVNRNLAFSHASAPLLLISDDDVEYTPERLRDVIDAFAQNEDCDFICFRYESDSYPKKYPEKGFHFSEKPPKGYYTTSFEIALRGRALSANDSGGKTPITFNENFGIGAPFGCGEEEIFIHDMIRAGLKGRFIPRTICRHDAATTATKENGGKEFIQTKGAMIGYLHPHTWPLRMLAHSLRQTGGLKRRFLYIRHWLSGFMKARRAGVYSGR